ncbi:Purine ribonucleoside efflux pump NepI [Mycolicibacterium vanbaalenii]|uniref:Purine ribonucleoside efflux pump NepI n=1 Tax=Mycolicibacterium vanbaalenii TaxID=110539 RepID=A0A5S9R6L9_MYCVN|nr:MFS transporter [Mycolicibacterium vanbaalenii]CAA0130416.1 Purine ribonucleoside efflux pump NepI [Mycolicibacterium vanbaalenii]
MTAITGATEEKSTFPLPALVVLSVVGFTTMLTETIPAGLLGDIGAALDTSDSVTGQLLTLYATASMLAAIPLTTFTRSWPRKPLLIATVVGIAAANAITAASSEFYVSAGARVLGGACAGIQWAMMAGYAMRMVDSTLKGRALSVAMAGIPIALAFGMPLGTMMGSAVGWRGVFVILAVTGTLAGALGAWWLPRFDGEAGTSKLSFNAVVVRPGIAVIVLCAFAFQAAHMNLYTYIEPYLRLSDLGNHIGAVLLALGVAAIVGLWVTGATIDRHLTALGLTVLSLFCLAMGTLGRFAGVSPVVVAAVIAWGFALGCAPTLYQTACARAAGPSIDVAQAILVTLFNAGMAAGSLLGGIILSSTRSAHALPWISSGIFAVILVAMALTRVVSLPTTPENP